MPAQQNENIQYFGSDGLPLVDGLIYIGTAGLEPIGNLTSIFADEDLSVALSNPQTIGSDGFSANKIYIADQYSLRVESVLGEQIVLDLNVGSSETIGVTTLTNVQGTEAITADTSLGITSYVNHEIFVLTAANTIDQASGVTLDIDEVGAKAIVKHFNQPLDPGDFTQTRPIVLVYSSANDNFEWVNANVKTERLFKGADIPSASSITILDNDGNVFDITGSQSIGAINGVAGTPYIFQIDSAPIFLNSASLIMLGGDFQASTGDVLEFLQLTSSIILNTNIGKADGTAVVDSSPLTTEGDISVHNGIANVRLPVGTDGQFLKADSNESTGLIWGEETDPSLARDLSTVTVESTASQVTIFSFTVPAGTLGTNKLIRANLSGLYTNNTGVNRSLGITFQYGGVTVLSEISSPIGTTSLANGWSLEVYLCGDDSTTAQKGWLTWNLGQSSGSQVAVLTEYGTATQNSANALLFDVKIFHSAGLSTLSITKEAAFVIVE